MILKARSMARGSELATIRLPSRTTKTLRNASSIMLESPIIMGIGIASIITSSRSGSSTSVSMM